MTKKKVEKESLIHQKEHDKAAEIAEYYGLTPIETPKVDSSISKKIKTLKETPHSFKFSSKCEESLYSSNTLEKATLVNNFTSKWRHLSKPISLFYELPMKETGKKKLPKTAYYGLDVIGSSQSVSDALLIQTTKSILVEMGYKKLNLEVNCTGERDASARFERELISYFRKHINQLTPDEQKIFKDDVFHLLSYPKKSKTLQELMNEAPQAMSFLTETGREHFMKVLEHLEELGIEYVINGHLIESKYYSTYTSFAFKDEKGHLLAIGSRYDILGRKIGFRRELPAVGSRICIREKKARKKVKAHKFPTRCFYFMQLGPEAKVKSLKIIDDLRKKKIPVCHSLTKDKASSQLGSAGTLKMPYTLIMGKKEAMEGTVAIRENETRSQKIVPVSDLSKELTKIKKSVEKRK